MSPENSRNQQFVVLFIRIEVLESSNRNVHLSDHKKKLKMYLIIWLVTIKWPDWLYKSVLSSSNFTELNSPLDETQQKAKPTNTSPSPTVLISVFFKCCLRRVFACQSE